MVDSPRPPGNEPLNPFESSFALFRALSDEIRNLKAVVEDLTHEHSARLDKVETDLKAAKLSLSRRCDQLQTSHNDEKVSRNSRFDRMCSVVEDLRKKNNIRIDQLDAQMKQAMSWPAEQNHALDQKLRSEAAQLRNMIAKQSQDLGEHRQRVSADQTTDRDQFNALRADVEKLAALLSQSSLNRDPFNQLGYRHMQPGGPYMSLGTTANGSCLPPLMDANEMVTATIHKITRPKSANKARVGVFDQGNPTFDVAATARLNGSKV